MHDNVPVIEKHPVAVIEAFYPKGLYSVFQEFLIEVFGNGLYLCGAVRRADNKVIGDYGEAGQFKDNQIFRFLRKRCLCRLDGQISTP
jgi:hypothetical protein